MTEQTKKNNAAYKRKMEWALPSWSQIAAAYEQISGEKISSVRVRQVCVEAEVKIATAMRQMGML